MSAVLEADNLTKAYGAVKALDGLSLSVPPGGVYGVLGPNGAGKSTLFRIWLGLIRPTEGEGRIMGGVAGKDAKAARRTGSMIETPRFPPFLTARQTLVMLSRASGLKNNAARIDTLLDRVNLTEAADRKVKGFSVGMAQRLGIAAALLNEPELLILDEPTSGMDPAGINEIRNLIRSLADDDGVTVVLASHQLAEVQRVCNRVAILDHGKLVSEDTIDEMVSGSTQHLRISGSPVTAIMKVLGKKGTRDGEAVLARIDRKEAPDLIRRLVAEKVNITEARWVGGDLEKVFLQQTGEPRAN
ncbi:MAG: ABC transporter ATP-binding protein [Caulobacteraceae bacterium]|nr:ABC transporter ATP-binding protein [Caulobacteraceae bacterium]